MVTTVVPGSGRNKQPDPTELQIQTQRFIDDYTSRTFQSLDNYARDVGTEKAYIQALQLKVNAMESMTAIASGPNPNVNLLDLVSVATLMPRIIEDHWIKTPDGSAFKIWLDNSRIVETNAWQLAATFLPSNQVAELSAQINKWYLNNPEFRNGFLARPHEFAALVRSPKEHKSGVDSVFNLVGLDPTIGLDPAVREVTRTRLFAERAMYTLQRLPQLIRMQTELATYNLVGVPQIQQVVSNTTSLSKSVESIGQTAAQLPDRITAEREAIVKALQEQEGQLRELSDSMTRTLESGTKMSDSLNITVTTFDGLMKRFGVGEPQTNSAPSTNSAPFNILDYGKSAEQIGAMAKDINTLLNTAHSNVTQLTLLSEDAATKLNRTVDRAFWRGVLLLVIFLVGAVLAGLTYRALARKFTDR